MKRILIFALILFLQENLSARLPDLIPYRKGKLWGYCDSTKKMIIELKYDYALPFDKGFAIAGSTALHEIIDKEDKTVMKSSLDYYQSTLRAGEFIFADTSNHNFGVIDIGGDTIIKRVYTYINVISIDFYACYTGKGMNIVDRKGTVIFKSDNVDIFSYPEYIPDLGVFIVSNKKKYGVVNLEGAVKIPLQYLSVTHENCNYFTCYGKRVDFWDDHFSKMNPPDESCPVDMSRMHSIPKSIETEENDKKIEKYGWYDYESKRFVREPQYQFTGYFRNGFAQFEDDGKFGFVDKNFREVIQARYNHVSDFDENSLAEVSKLISEDKKSGDKYYDRTGYIDIHGTEYWEN